MYVEYFLILTFFFFFNIFHDISIVEIFLIYEFLKITVYLLLDLGKFNNLYF